MNKRIKQLAEQAGFIEAWFSESGDDCEREIKKFAELIVLETLSQMAMQMDMFGDNQANNPAWYKAENTTKKHFGVE